jgi:hypothetical protein
MSLPSMIGKLVALALIAGAWSSSNSQPPSPLATVEIEMVNSHIYVPVTLQGRHGWFLLDSGATSSILDSTSIDRYHLAVTQDEVRDTVLIVGGVTIDKQVFSVKEMHLQNAQFDGHDFDGLLGYDFIKRFVLEVDTSHHQMRLYRPETYGYPRSATIVPVRMLGDDDDGALPVVSATILVGSRGELPIQGNFVLDTGARPDIFFTMPFNKIHSLAASTSPRVELLVSGGPSVKRQVVSSGRLPALSLGNTRFSSVLAGFPDDPHGPFATDAVDGVIGEGVLKRVGLILDYSRKQIGIIPQNGLYTEPPMDHSGIILIAEGTELQQHKVVYVVTHSPAAEAGVSVGDELLAIDGKEQRGKRLEEVRQILAQAHGTITITCSRGGKNLVFRITLRKYI